MCCPHHLQVSKDANDHWEVAPDKQASCLRHCAYPCQQRNNGTVLYMCVMGPCRCRDAPPPLSCITASFTFHLVVFILSLIFL